MVPTSAALERMRVVFADDDADVRAEFLAFLLQAGVDVCAVGYGKEALARIESDPSITVMLTDLSMPDMDGLELAARVREIRPNSSAVEVIILTGRREFTDVAPGVFRILQKPVKLDNLLTVLGQAHHAAITRRTDRKQLE